MKGVNGDTPLGYVVSIRSETDKERIDKMTKHEKKIRSEWQKFRMEQHKKNAPSNVVTLTVDQFQQLFKGIAREVKK